MSLNPFGFDDAPGWGAPLSASEDVVTAAIRKEQLIKQITSAQEDLRALFDKVQIVQKDVEKLASGNETLQMYIDNLTMQMAKRR
ncbi:hypothetical protein C8Q75DRAFT_720069 [Abortiporus biennis]|nr:hypothetical protein C8Q75DRAFT_720069 [Abortiporus biennis]